MRVGRDVQDKLSSRIRSGLRLVPGERIELVVRTNGGKPPADCLVITNGRMLALDTSADPLTWARRQVLADEVRIWQLTRKFRSRLVVTSGYGRTDVLASGLSVYDDDLVDEHVTQLVGNREHAGVLKVLRALRAEAHWVTSAYGRSVYVLDRECVPSTTAEVIDLDIVERQLSQFDFWPGSEVRRHLAACLPAGGCHFAGAESMTWAAPTPSGGAVAREHVVAVVHALVTVDAARVRKAAGAEADVLHELMAVVAAIRSNPAWTSGHLDEKDARVDVDAEIRQIALQCHRVAELRADMGPKPQTRSETGSRASAVYDAAVASLDTLARRLEDRVIALAAYRDRLRTLARELADLDSATHISAVAEKVAVLAGADGADDVGGMVPYPRQPDDAVPEAVAAVRDEAERVRSQDISMAVGATHSFDPDGADTSPIAG
ncbi:hypothetical protein G1H11_05005 [Phytoactinopolyspora alkaliphila]|uniref:Uncharacterized protein n=1 Tax=Phytoactinopolyspora alkaliphila TaxID=1783498 RepID=A0A6N9YI74_9ACTN|nr:hypothetical protein [Phytoactinopolyspora alkaliphila]NED94664.1 hypothetical protein [Phytoactinopolyspora alkaliphila]